MDERRLMIFRAVAEQRNFTRAAESLHLSQPTVSQQVQALEEEMSVRLFDRTSKSVDLTPAGHALYARTGALLQQFAELKRAVLEAAGAVSGTLVLGASLTIGEYLLPRAIALFGQEYPLVEVKLHIQNTEQIVHRLMEGSFDLGLVEGPLDVPELVQETFLEDELLVIAPVNHPWREKPLITPADLKAERLILREPGSGTRQYMEEYLRAAGIKPGDLQATTVLSGMESIKGAVEAGMGISVLSEWTIRKELRLGTLLARRLGNLPMKRSLRVVRPSGHSLIPAAKAFLRVLQSDLWLGR